jgi:hypothetical protein
LQLRVHSGCHFRNVAEGEDIKGGKSPKSMVWCVCEVLRTLLEAAGNGKTGQMD